MNKVLLIRHIKAINANALSSPITVGFPAITSWLGFVYALQRKLNANECYEIQFDKTAIISHKFELQSYHDNDGKNKTIIYRKPLVKKGVDFETPAFIPDARCSFDVSLIININSENNTNLSQEDSLLQSAQEILPGMKMAGGDIVSIGDIKIMTIDDENSFKRLKAMLYGGCAILGRKDLMGTSTDRLDDILRAMSVKVEPVISDNNEFSGEWTKHKEAQGWIVPIAVGFRGISPICEVKNQRSYDYPHRFAESVITLGEFRMMYRISSLDEIFWEYKYDNADNGMYLCVNNEKEN